MDMNDRILIVDDEETLCEALRFNLEAEGYRVDTANSAEQVLAMDVSGYDHPACKNPESESGHRRNPYYILYGERYGKRYGFRS